MSEGRGKAAKRVAGSNPNINSSIRRTIHSIRGKEAARVNRMDGNPGAMTKAAREEVRKESRPGRAKVKERTWCAVPNSCPLT